MCPSVQRSREKSVSDVREETSFAFPTSCARQIASLDNLKPQATPPFQFDLFQVTLQDFVWCCLLYARLLFRLDTLVCTRKCVSLLELKYLPLSPLSSSSSSSPSATLSNLAPLLARSLACLLVVIVISQHQTVRLPTYNSDLCTQSSIVRACVLPGLWLLRIYC